MLDEFLSVFPRIVQEARPKLNAAHMISCSCLFWLIATANSYAVNLDELKKYSAVQNESRNLFVDIGVHYVGQEFSVGVRIPSAWLKHQRVAKSKASCSCITIENVVENGLSLERESLMVLGVDASNHKTGLASYSIYIQLEDASQIILTLQVTFYEVCPKEVFIGSRVINGFYVAQFYINPADSRMIDSPPLVELIEYDRNLFDVKDTGVVPGPFGQRRGMEIRVDVMSVDVADGRILELRLKNCPLEFRIAIRRDPPLSWFPKEIIADYSTSDSISFMVYSPLDLEVEIVDSEMLARATDFRLEITPLNRSAQMVTVEYSRSFSAEDLPCINRLKLKVNLAECFDRSRKDRLDLGQKVITIPFYLIDRRVSSVFYPSSR